MKSHVFFPLLAATGAASLPQMPSFFFGFLAKSQNLLSVFSKAKICNGKTKGLALRSPHFHSAFIAKVKKHKLHTHGPKFLSEKQMVFALCQFT